MASLELESVSKRFGALKVIHDVSLSIEDGEFVVLVGPSGCGKSTLLRMMAGLEDISDGLIVIDDQVVNDVPPKSRDISMVFQSYALYPHMTVTENMGFSMRLRGASKTEQEKEVDNASRILGLADYLKRFPRQLSGGQRQRVAMGRALVRNPKLFLFDEPLSNLDAKLRVQMRAEIKRLHHRLGTTMVYVTHDQIEAMTMADKIVVLRDGVVEQIGAPLELYDRPASQFVGGFIGSPAMNFFSGRIVRSDGPAFESSAGVVPLCSNISSREGDDVILGIRPHDFQLSDHGLAGRVAVVEPTGSETMLHAEIGDVATTVVMRDRVEFSPGAQIHLVPEAGKFHLFSPTDGTRL